MKVVYGSALPPNLTAPTRGELKVSIERLVLHEELLADVPALAPLLDTPLAAAAEGSAAAAAAAPMPAAADALQYQRALRRVCEMCAIAPQFWGEATPSAECLPPLERGPARDVPTVVFPVRTLAAQFEQYLLHSSMAAGGLALMLMIPGAKLGRKHALLVGAATLSLAALTETTPLTGWFTITAAGAGASVVGIGRLRVRVALHFFAGAAAAEKPPSSSQQRGGGQRGVSSSTTPQGPAGGASAVPRRMTGGSDDIGKQQRADREGRPPLHVVRQRPAAAAAAATTEDQSKHAKQHTEESLPTDASSTAGLSAATHSTGSSEGRDGAEAAAMAEILARGRRLRDELAAAAALSDLPATNKGSLYTANSGPLPAAPPPMSAAGGLPLLPTGIEHRIATASVDGSMDDEDVPPTDSDDDHLLGSPGRLQAQAQAQSPPREYARHATVHVRLSGFAFTRVVEELRIGLRVSKDVACPVPFDALSSFVYHLPDGSGAGAALDVTIPLHFAVTHFSSESRVALEAIAVTSTPADRRGARVVSEEEVLGVVFIGLYTAAPRSITFHDPITGENPVVATVEVRVVADDGEGRAGHLLHTRNQLADSAHHQLRLHDNTRPAAVPRADGAAVHSPQQEVRGPRNSEKPRRHRSPSSTSSGSRSSSSNSRSTSSSSSDGSHGGRRHRRRGYAARAVSSRHANSGRVVVVSDRDATATVTVTPAGAAAVASPGPHRPRALPALPHTSTQAVPYTPLAAVGAAAGAHSQRLHVTLRQAKELPCVRLRGPAVALAPSDMASPLADFVPPRAFLVLEEFVLGEGPAVPPQEGPLAGPSTAFRDFRARLESSDHGPRSRLVPWSVLSALRGVGDRTLVAEASQRPLFHFEATVALAASDPAHDGKAPTGLLVSLWHHQPPADGEQEEDSAEGCADGGAAEERFWTRAVRLGTAFVDLRPIKYMGAVEGWYRVLSDHHAVDTPMGYLQLAVRRV